MMLFKALQAYSDYWRYPAVRDYVRMGYGIEARFRRCRTYWKRHLELSREFQRQALNSLCSFDSVAVLGAGRLLDVAIDEIFGRFQRIDLFDADPSALRSWQALQKRFGAKRAINFSCCDLSGSIQSWSNKLRFFLKHSKSREVSDLVSFLNELVLEKPREINSYQCILSLNLLSQIPIYWRDRFYSYAADFWSLDTDPHGRFEPALQQAFEHTQKRLEEQHLAMLAASQAALIVIISDRYFYYYQCDKSAWQVEPALQLENKLELPGFTSARTNSWFWHIAPQGVEQQEHGIIHEVWAEEFRRLAQA